MKNDITKYELRIAIEQTQNRIDSGLISNPVRLRFAKRDIKIWKEKLNKLENP